MKKILLSLPLLATLMFGAQTTDSLQLLNDDVKALNSYGMSSLDNMVKSQKALEEYKTRFDNYSDELSKFSQQKMEAFSNKDDALKSMDALKELSSQSVVMAKELAYLSSHQMDNASDDYKATLKTLSKTTLRLSDDIGTMSDRILTMADKIGVMADRIVETQKIQSKNLNTTTALVHTSMNMNSMDIGTHTRAISGASRNVRTHIKTISGASSSMQSYSAQRTGSTPRQQSGQMQNMAGMAR